MDSKVASYHRRYTLTNSLHMVNVANTKMVLVVQWFFSIVENFIDNKVLEMKFQDPDGRQVELKGINAYPNQVLSSQSMIYTLSHEEIKWDVECLITSQGTNIDISQHLEDINRLLHKHEKVFGYLPHDRPPDIGVEHSIELEIGKKPIKMQTYRYPKRILR